MLLFSDGFETFHINDLARKWGIATIGAGASIVHGTELSTSKPYARKEGRALYQPKGGVTSLNVGFRPSRTLYFGFAVRGNGTAQDPYIPVELYFYGKNDVSSQGSETHIARLALKIEATRVVCTWYFRMAPVNGAITYSTVTGVIATNANMVSGDYHYIQGAFTLHGNVAGQPQAWAEVRVGQRQDKVYQASNIYTSATDSNQLFYANNLSLVFGRGYWQSTGYAYGGCIDDFYLCNDEGPVNNTFLGNVNVRRVLPVAEGSANDSVPYGTMFRFQAVDEDFISFGIMPTPQPDPEVDPLFLPWENGDEDYITLSTRGEKQYFLFNNVDFQGSQPIIHGTILHALCDATQYGGALVDSGLVGLRKIGVDAPIESTPIHRPVYKSGAFLPYRFAFDNTEIPAEGQPYQEWSATVVNGSEWGVKLEPVAIDPNMCNPRLTRFNLKFDDIVVDQIALADFSHRYFEEPVAEGIDFADFSGRDYTWFFDEELYFQEQADWIKVCTRFLVETLNFTDVIPWTYLFAGEFLAFEEAIQVDFIDTVDEAIAVADWATGFWEELFNDEFGVSDISVASFIMILDEAFGLEEPYLWDGHEDIDETLALNVTYVWDNHEIIEEYLYPDDVISQGIGLDIADGFDLTEDHHDARWVEISDDNLAATDEVLTQHWRYEFFWGYCISSWQVTPVEQAGNDGNHSGSGSQEY